MISLVRSLHSNLRQHRMGGNWDSGWSILTGVHTKKIVKAVRDLMHVDAIHKWNQ
jgi:hypothetical protein